MNSINLNIRKTFCALSALLTLCMLISALLMSVGIAFGRYYTVESLDVSFDISQKGLPTVEYAVPTAGGGAWESKNGTHVLAFSLTNADGVAVSEKDQHFRVRLFVPTATAGAADPLGGVALNLHLGAKQYAASRQELSTKTVLSEKQDSSGWIYYFDVNGELVHTLEGGGESTLEMSLNLLGGTAPTDYELIIDPVFVDSSENIN
ncbi:MAG: hypothetical protein IKM46_02340 [Clostridia bacterium]|nr:hypothetical protein [Clostridia bacterium]